MTMWPSPQIPAARDGKKVIFFNTFKISKIYFRIFFLQIPSRLKRRYRSYRLPSFEPPPTAKLKGPYEHCSRLGCYIAQVSVIFHIKLDGDKIYITFIELYISSNLFNFSFP
jgi:hypothetical protein